MNDGDANSSCFSGEENREKRSITWIGLDFGLLIVGEIKDYVRVSG